MKFEHLKFTKEEVKKLNIKVLKKRTIWKGLDKIHKDMMRKHGHNYNPTALWEDIEKRCVLHSNDEEVLVAMDRYNEIIKIFKSDENCDRMSFYHIKEFNVLGLMFLRDQISEC